MIKHFLTDLSGITPDWTMDQVLEEQLKKINDLVIKGMENRNPGSGMPADNEPRIPKSEI